MTMPDYIPLGLFVMLWVVGWASTIGAVDINGGLFWKTVIGPAILFFVWPYIAYCMFTVRH